MSNLAFNYFLQLVFTTNDESAPNKKKSEDLLNPNDLLRGKLTRPIFTVLGGSQASFLPNNFRQMSTGYVCGRPAGTTDSAATREKHTRVIIK